MRGLLDAFAAPNPILKIGFIPPQITDFRTSLQSRESPGRAGRVPIDRAVEGSL
jgi:hypothetical protein